jgi:leucine dehydrogenase
MKTFELMRSTGHEELLFCHHQDAGLRAIIAIHDTTLGPALGGTRMWNYSSEDEAIVDVLRLSRGMTYKSAVAGLNMGGGKAVILGDSKLDKSEMLFRAFGRFVNSLGGRFITGEDVGVDVNDVEYMYMETPFVVGLSPFHGGGGDPAPVTAFGVLQGIKACIVEKYGTDSLDKKTVALQGLGSVGFRLAQYLKSGGATVIASDIDHDRVSRARSELKIEIIPSDEITRVKADIFSPCAMGGIINDSTLRDFNFAIVAGAANNQLMEERHGSELHEKGILYAPDYVINAGGMINVFVELEGYLKERAMRMTRGIYYNLRRIFAISKEHNIPTYKAADQLAEERISKMKQVRARPTLDVRRPRHTI